MNRNPDSPRNIVLALIIALFRKETWRAIFGLDR